MSAGAPETKVHHPYAWFRHCLCKLVLGLKEELASSVVAANESIAEEALGLKSIVSSSCSVSCTAKKHITSGKKHQAHPSAPTTATKLPKAHSSLQRRQHPRAQAHSSGRLYQRPSTSGTLHFPSQRCDRPGRTARA